METSPYIASTFYETKYYILRTCFLLRKGLIEEAKSTYENEYLPMIKNCSVPKEVLTYEYYYLGGRNLLDENPLESLRYYKIVLNNTDSPSFKGIINYNIGLSYFKVNKLEESLTYIKKASESYLLENKQKELADTFNLMGTVYIKKEELSVASKYLELGLKIAQQYEYTSVKSRILHNLAIINKRNEELSSAINLLEKSLSLKVDINNIIITAIELIEVLIIKKEVRKAQHYINKIEQDINKLSPINFHKFLLIRGKVYLKTGNLEQYIKDYDAALDFFLEKEIWKYIKLYTEEYGDTLFKYRKYKKASEVYKLTLLSKRKD
ncbi:tetratricopeptide repeat protein [Virgibacillus pantothenticus]|uniref:tetratricopeptide repeat protein n=1 Tax=Virgibacillus pantothenticus TaxID=1473 RepID=UPI0020148DE3|nr:hypothetical protein [Virgibacillus pantothenticus]